MFLLEMALVFPATCHLPPATCCTIPCARLLDSLQPVCGGDAGARPRHSESPLPPRGLSRGACLVGNVDRAGSRVRGTGTVLARTGRGAPIPDWLRNRALAQRRQPVCISCYLPLFQC